MKKTIFSLVWVLIATVSSLEAETTNAFETTQQSTVLKTNDEMALLPPSSIENGNTNKPNKETAPKPGKKGLRIVGNVLVGLLVGFVVVVAVFIISYTGNQH
ncbi:MAG: hypothetical protein EBU80_11215 [Chitinophagia bacterium]|jgi:hypothetical protein|nr:hypothetical protein [Chitinophagia bacterium]